MRRGEDLGPEEPPRDGGGQSPLVPSRSGISLRQVIIVVGAVLLIAFAAANFDRVEVSFLLFDSDARLVTVIVVAAALGFVIGYFIGRPSREQRKRLAKLDDD